MQIAFGLRRQTPQLLSPGGAIAQFRNERFGTGNHGRIGAIVRIRPGGRSVFGFRPTPAILVFLAISSAMRF